MRFQHRKETQPVLTQEAPSVPSNCHPRRPATAAMSPVPSQGTQGTRCLNVRAVALSLSVFHMIMSLILLIEHSLEVGNSSCCKDLNQSYYHIADIVSGYLLLIVLLVISVTLMWGVVKHRGTLVMPFLALQVMDFILSSLMLCSTYIELPAYLNVGRKSQVTVSKPLSPAWGALDMCLSLLTLCSSYVEVPTYLNFRSMNHMNYFPRNDLVTPRKFVTELIFFNLLFIAVLFHKAFLIRCVWRFFRSLENPKKPKVKEATEHHDTFHVVPPLYEEAVKMPANECPPPPYTAV